MTDKKAETAGVQANRIQTAVHTFFDWAIEKKIISVNPAAHVKPPTEETPRDRFLDDNEIEGKARGRGR